MISLLSTGMGAWGARTFAATTLHFNYNRQNSDAVSARVPLRIPKRAAVSICKAKDGVESARTDVTVNDQQGDVAPASQAPSPSPFVSGKISSRVKVRPVVQQEIDSTSSDTTSRPPISSPSVSKKAFTSSPGLSSSSLKPSRPAKAFQAPEVSSPFDTPVKKPANNNGLRSFADVDERVLASRKEILNALYKEEKKEPKLNSFPANVVDDPKPLPGDGEYKFELIRGTSPVILIISFSLIAGLMFGTAFVAWKLGAFHYDEL